MNNLKIMFCALSFKNNDCHMAKKPFDYLILFNLMKLQQNIKP